MRFATAFIVSTQLLNVSASGAVDCSRGDAQCIALFGGESHCKYWQSSPVCHGSSTPCNCDGTLPVVPTDPGQSFVPVPSAAVEADVPQVPQRRRRVFVVNNSPAPAAPPANGLSAAADSVPNTSLPPSVPQVPQRQRRVFVINGGSNSGSNSVNRPVAPVVQSLPAIEIPQGLSPEVATVRSTVEQFVLRRTSEQAMFNQIVDRIERVSAEVSSLTFDEAFDQLGGNRLLDFIAQAGERRSTGLAQHSPESMVMILASAIAQAVPGSIIPARIQQDICTSKIDFLKNIVRGTNLGESVIQNYVNRSTFAAGWVRVCPALQDDVVVARYLMLHGVRRHQSRHCSSGHCHALNVVTTRDRMLDDAYGMMGAAGPISHQLLNNLLAGVSSADLGEIGHGPGVRRDWFSDLAEKLFGSYEYGLYERSESAPYYTKISTLAQIADPVGSMSWYRMSGRFMALSIIQDIPVGIDFPLFYFALLSGQPVTMEHIRLDEPELFESLQRVVDMDAETLQLVGAALEGSGTDEELTIANRMDQINARLANMIRSPADITEQMEQIRQGFFEVLPREIFDGFTPANFRSFIVGLDDVDIDDLSNNIQPEGYTAQSGPVVNFLNALRDMTQQERRQILKYITGSSRVPLGGFRRLYPNRMRITRVGGTDQHLPGAHTCFNQIELPPYSSKEVALERLRKTLETNPKMTMHIA